MSLTTAASAQRQARETAPALRLSSISAGYGRTAVLRDVSISVPQTEIVALLGPNGAGKTTLLRTASGLLRPTSGTIEIAGKDVTRASPAKRARAGLSLIPEGRGIWRNLTVRENLRLQVPPWLRNDSVAAAIEMFPILGDRLDQAAGTLSGGQQQMVALSRAYLAQPSVVLLDEVSMGLAPKVVDEIFEALRKLADAGVALLLVEQYVTRALAMADRVVLLDRGHVSFSGRPSELDEEAVLRGYLGVEGTSDIGNTGRRRQVKSSLEIELDTDRCMAHGICMEVAPEYFMPDDDGYVSLVPGALDRGDSPQVQLAEASCPMRAIALRDHHRDQPNEDVTGSHQPKEM